MDNIKHLIYRNRIHTFKMAFGTIITALFCARATTEFCIFNDCRFIGILAIKWRITQNLMCASKNIDLMTKEQVLNSLKELNTSCKDVAFRIFGLSLTTYNILVSILMFVISIKIFLLNNNDIKK